ncbi:MAG TPA: glycoside hydrolase family 18 protein [Spirillospora sp.]|nr:glycoside hydrolase family 18 protein [Spirillospora sp.]
MEPEFPPPESEQPEDEPRRRGRARERQRRRRERQLQQAQPASRNLRQVLPPGRLRFTLPEIRIPRLRLVAGLIAGVVIIIGVVAFLRGLKPVEPEALPHALWVGTEWTYAVHEPESIEAFAQHLRENRIGTVYAWVSWLQEDATWRGAENFGAVRAFAEQIKEVYPELRLHGWLGFPTELGSAGYRLDNEELQQSIADFSASIVNELGFDGVFLNVEPVWNGNEDFLALLRKVRSTVGDGVPLSVAIPPDWSPENAGIPVPPLIVPGTIWETEYKQSVALLSDEMAVMAYNSGLTAPEDYTQWLAYQVETYAKAVGELGQGTEVLIGIPTYPEALPGHDPLVENVETALQGFAAGLEQAGDAASFVRGLAIYAEWTTDDLEWAQFGEWVKRQ